MVEKCGIHDVWGEFQRKGAVVLGPDSPRKHVKLREKYGLPFTLLSDEEHDVAAVRHVGRAEHVRQDVHGHGALEFVIDADGNVAWVMRKVKPADLAEDVLAALP